MRFASIFTVLSACFMMACGKPVDTPNPDKPSGGSMMDGLVQLEKLWAETTPFEVSKTRMDIFDKLQGYADACTSSAFKYMFDYDANKYSLTVKYDNILSCYDAAFDRVLNGLKTMRPKNGEVYIWMLYNMGYVIQTPSMAFAIDVYHYRADELAPYIDFYASTHVHTDHKSEKLMKAMYDAGKPVLSNFYEPQKNYQYYSTGAKDYTVGDCALHTFITRHNNGSTNVPVTVFQIDCGPDTGNFVLMHSGDSNFIASEYDVTLPIDVYIPRYAQSPLEENNIIGKVCEPDYVLLSHILELGHKDISESRWSLELGLERASKLDCKQTYMPFWGEVMIWSNNKLSVLK